MSDPHEKYTDSPWYRPEVIAPETPQADYLEYRRKKIYRFQKCGDCDYFQDDGLCWLATRISKTAVHTKAEFTACSRYQHLPK